MKIEMIVTDGKCIQPNTMDSVNDLKAILERELQFDGADPIELELMNFFNVVVEEPSDIQPFAKLNLVVDLRNDDGRFNVLEVAQDGVSKLIEHFAVNTADTRKGKMVDIVIIDSSNEVLEKALIEEFAKSIHSIYQGNQDYIDCGIVLNYTLEDSNVSPEEANSVTMVFGLEDCKNISAALELLQKSYQEVFSFLS